MSPQPFRIVVVEPGRTALHLTVVDPLEIGRDCAGLILDDPQISRRHLEVRVDGGRLVVADLDSTNGSSIDGVALTAPHPLEAGAMVMFGGCTLQLEPEPTSRGDNRGELGVTSIDLVAAAVAEDGWVPGQRERDGGTLTIVFSDIEQSTRRSEELGDERWVELLQFHNTLIRRQISRHRGNEVKANGDGFMLTFASARSAVRGMIEVQRALAAHARSRPTDALRIRVGIHTGEAVADDDGDIFGLHVNLAARIANEARGGEILVSSLVREIVGTRGDLEFGDPRTVSLKGLTGTHVVHPVCWDGEPKDTRDRDAPGHSERAPLS